MARKIETERRIGRSNDWGDLFEIESPLGGILETPRRDRLPDAWWEHVKDIETPRNENGANLDKIRNALGAAKTTGTKT